MSESEVDEPTGPIPVLAVVGRPNVGKSTLVNRIIGRREAVVEDVPGVTRDRVSYDANWAGRAFTVVDTGGWDPDARGLAASIRDQAEVAVSLADAVLFVVDATVGITDDDEAVVRILRASGSQPPVSTTVNARPAQLASYDTRSRVTPGTSSTTASRRPMIRFTSVDLPTLGRPTTARTGIGPEGSSVSDSVTLLPGR